MIQTEDLDIRALHDELAGLRKEVEALKERAERAEALADYDVLTPALNRRGFVQSLSRQMAYCTRHNLPAVLLYLDMDGFKQLNDQLGHAAGDGAIKAVVQVLIEQTRDSDFIGRLGGDEFAVALINADLDDGRAKAEHLNEVFKTQGFFWNGNQYSMSASIGVRAFNGQSDPEVWLAETDTAMWLRKVEKGSSR